MTSTLTATFDCSNPGQSNLIESTNMMFNLSCIECQNTSPVQPVPMTCCLRMICKPCIKRKAKELLTMPLKMKQQLMQLQTQKSGGQAPKELLYECPNCPQMHPIKEMLRWPINQVVDSYIKEVVNSSSGKENNSNIDAEEKLLANELGEEDSPFNKLNCERCEKNKAKLVCYECGTLGSALCEQCSQLIHQSGSFQKHKVRPILFFLLIKICRQFQMTRNKRNCNHNNTCWKMILNPSTALISAEITQMLSLRNTALLATSQCATNASIVMFKNIQQKILGNLSELYKIFRDATEEILNSFRGTLEKINVDRGKTDQMINQIKYQMTKAETDAHKTEHLIRAKTQQLKYQLEIKEKEAISNLHLQKQRILNQLVQDKIEMEDFKLKEFFPIKIFEILEEKVQSKELPVLTVLSQTKYFKKLLEQTYNMRKEQSKSRDQEQQIALLQINTEVVEQKMQQIASFLDQQFASIIKQEQPTRQSQQSPKSQQQQQQQQSNQITQSLIVQNTSNQKPIIAIETEQLLPKTIPVHLPGSGNSLIDKSQIEVQIINQRDSKVGDNSNSSNNNNSKAKVHQIEVLSQTQNIQKKTIVLGQQSTNMNSTQQNGNRSQEDSKSQSRQTYQSKISSKQVVESQQNSDKTLKSKTKREKETTPKSYRTGTNIDVDKSVEAFQEKLSLIQAQSKQNQASLLKKRQFTKTECSSTSIKLQWEHQKEQQFSFGSVTVIYILEYGIGVKVNGVEQFRQVYQGKAHRCIITDLNPRTNYRIRVAAAVASPENQKDIQEIGDWSDVIQVSTLDNQKINNQTINEESVSRFNMLNVNGINGDQQIDMESSFISTYSQTNLHSHNNRMNANDSFIFNNPAYIHGEQEWTFGKHFFQVDSNIFDGKADISFTCFLTVGLICTVATKSKQDKTPNKNTPQITKKKAEVKKEDIEQVIVGCKVGVKDSAYVQVYVNLEKHLLLCIANGKIHEKFDLSNYSSCVPVIKYDGDAHLQGVKVVASASFDLQVPFSIEQIAQEYIHETQVAQQQLLAQQQQIQQQQQNRSQSSNIASGNDSNSLHNYLVSPQANIMNTKSMINAGMGQAINNGQIIGTTVSGLGNNSKRNQQNPLIQSNQGKYLNDAISQYQQQQQLMHVSQSSQSSSGSQQQLPTQIHHIL
ncbi:UNKNOWN [Stylonychia lemnae]|uniref:Fibronectin type-III domain-containing protein n=1 Tax=Stylonychia lemnae TaxID=5949 RepID=A0A078ABF4_STYLE|nr:UNKNOWN [Stylonychia lemnae]|eukprot:CDW79206.1 UNKNOWN [Stylonychia lemnae]